MYKSQSTCWRCCLLLYSKKLANKDCSKSGGKLWQTEVQLHRECYGNWETWRKTWQNALICQSFFNDNVFYCTVCYCHAWWFLMHSYVYIIIIIPKHMLASQVLAYYLLLYYKPYNLLTHRLHHQYSLVLYSPNSPVHKLYSYLQNNISVLIYHLKMTSMLS